MPLAWQDLAQNSDAADAKSLGVFSHQASRDHLTTSAIDSCHLGDIVCILLGTLRVVSGHAYVPTWHMQADRSSMVEDPGWSYGCHMAVLAIGSSHSGDMVCVLLGTLRVVSGHAYVPTWHMQAVKSRMVEDPGWSYSYHMAVSAIVSSHSGDMVCVLLGMMRVASGHAYVPTWHMQAVKSSLVEDPGWSYSYHMAVLAIDSSHSGDMV